MPILLIVYDIYGLKSKNGEKLELLPRFLAHPVERPWPILTVIKQSVHRSVPYILDYIWHRWEKQKQYLSYARMRPPLISGVFNSPYPSPPLGRCTAHGRGHVGKHCHYTNNSSCGSVQPLLRYRSKTAKMQKFPIDSHSNENFICLFFRPPGAANPQTTSFPSLMFALPWAKISRRSHHPASTYAQLYKQEQKQKRKQQT